MELTVQMEKPSSILRKLTIRVPAQVVTRHFEKGLAEVQRTANLKGFRPGQAPISVVKQFYGDDVRHRVFHDVIDEAFKKAVSEQNLKAVGQPTIDTPEHKTGEGAHDHAIREGQDLTFTAVVEVLPEIEVRGYKGISLTREKVEVTEADAEKVIESLRDSRAELVPIGGGLALPDGSTTSRPVQKGDHVDMAFEGGMVTETGIDKRPGMTGARILEIGSDSLIPGFEDNLIGMRRGEVKTFRVGFPQDYHEKDMAGKESEFTVTVNELKEKKLQPLDEEFSKQLGYENLTELRKKVHEHLLKERTDEANRKIRNELIGTLIEKNPFDVPVALIESQTRSLAQDWAGELKRQGLDDKMIQDVVMRELDNLRKRAESQVRSSLILEAVSRQENIEISDQDYENEMTSAATAMNVELEKLREFYDKNPGRKEDFSFRLRQERAIGFLLDNAKIKSKA